MSLNRAIPYSAMLLVSAVWGLQGRVKVVRAAELSSTNAAIAPRTILVLGDSLAAGQGLEIDEAFPALLQKKIEQKGWKFSVVNAGVSGDTSAGGLRRINWLLRQKIDVLVLELGANDGLRGIPPEVTRSNLQAIIDRTKAAAPKAEVVVVGMKMPPNMGEQYRTEFEGIFPALAKKNDAVLVPFLLEGVGGNPELNQGDRIHPTAEGQRIVAENVWKVLEPLLRQRAGWLAAPAMANGKWQMAKQTARISV